MAKKARRTGNSKKKDSILFAFLATFLSIAGFILALVTKRDDKYVMFYAKQSLIVFAVAIIVGVIAAILLPIFAIGQIIYVVLQALIVIMWILSWFYALSGNMKEVPVIGRYARKMNL